jgi:hypothetical protein
MQSPFTTNLLHLNEETVPTTLNHLKEVKAKAHEFLDTLTDILSENEYNYIRSTINKCNVPTVSLLVCLEVQYRIWLTLSKYIKYKYKLT